MLNSDTPVGQLLVAIDTLLPQHSIALAPYLTYRSFPTEFTLNVTPEWVIAWIAKGIVYVRQPQY